MSSRRDSRGSNRGNPRSCRSSNKGISSMTKCTSTKRRDRTCTYCRYGSSRCKTYSDYMRSGNCYDNGGKCFILTSAPSRSSGGYNPGTITKKRYRCLSSTKKIYYFLTITNHDTIYDRRRSVDEPIHCIQSRMTHRRYNCPNYTGPQRLGKILGMEQSRRF